MCGWHAERSSPFITVISFLPNIQHYQPRIWWALVSRWRLCGNTTPRSTPPLELNGKNSHNSRLPIIHSYLASFCRIYTHTHTHTQTLAYTNDSGAFKFHFIAYLNTNRYNYTHTSAEPVYRVIIKIQFTCARPAVWRCTVAHSISDHTSVSQQAAADFLCFFSSGGELDVHVSYIVSATVCFFYTTCIVRYLEREREKTPTRLASLQSPIGIITVSGSGE